MIDQKQSSVKVWDPVVRIFHWSLVAAFIVAWLTGDDFETLHENAGYVILGLIAVRLVWGLVGPRYARFTQFVPSIAGMTAYLREMMSGRERRYLGHNPAGGAMVVALILALVATGGTGWPSCSAGPGPTLYQWPGSTPARSPSPHSSDAGAPVTRQPLTW